MAKNKLVHEKLIVINTAGTIHTFHNLTGPIRTPVKVSTDKIFAMLSQGVDIEEVLVSGNRIKLDLKNYNLDANAPKVVVEEAAKIVEEAEVIVTDTNGDVSTTEAVVVNVAEEKLQKNKQQFNNNNRNNGQRR